MADFASSLSELDQDVSDAELIDRIAALEELKSAASAAQAHATVSFDVSHRRKQSDGSTRAKPGEGIVSQIALARHDSPALGSRHLSVGKALVNEMPHTLNALTIGVLSEWRATILVRETACLDVEDRARVDEAMAADPKALKGLGDRRLISEAKKHAYVLDPRSVVRRAAKAESERTVTCRPAPDTMTYVTGLLPVAQGVAVKAALSQAADHHIRITGDERGRGQIMADTLVERVTGRTFTNSTPGAAGTDQRAEPAGLPGGTALSAETTGLPGTTGYPEETARRRDTVPGTSGQDTPDEGNSLNTPAAGVGVEVQLIMTDRALFAGDNEPAYLHGYGTVPAGWARNLIRNGGNTDGDNVSGREDGGSHHNATSPRTGDAGQSAAGRIWIRRLYTAPDTGRLISMDSRARIFPQGLRRFLISRDQTCRTPWCDAPIRHIDHITPHSKGGQTSEANSQGLCQRCNLAKEAPGFTAKPIDGPRHSVQLTTPTGHTYESTAPPPPGTPWLDMAMSKSKPRDIIPIRTEHLRHSG
ncbi:hypothetical protein GCM10027402_07980 [Arthrobacter monumenti]